MDLNHRPQMRQDPLKNIWAFNRREFCLRKMRRRSNQKSDAWAELELIQPMSQGVGFGGPRSYLASAGCFQIGDGLEGDEPLTTLIIEY